MAIRVDPEGNETRALFELADLDGSHVLEVGCGDGRLTWRYASKVAHVTAIDPFPESVVRAKKSVPEELRGRVEIVQAAFDDIPPSRGPSAFDTVILSWSLC
jgi:cyclopropane fatty-acyl-phospholipid synthase-like methyltransferase